MYFHTRLALALIVMALAVPAHATTWHVPSECLTIQAGIDSAGAGDTVLVACDTYYEHDIIMKPGIHLASETGEADCVTVDAQGLGRGICCLDVHDASIVGFTVVGGQAPGGRASPDSAGGGIYCENSSPELTKCLFMDNEAVYGGGMVCWNSSHPALTLCTFMGNSASFGGGGMFCYLNSDPTLTDCEFSGNSSFEGGGFSCFMGCFPTLTDCEFTENTAYDGGGMMSFICWPELTGCLFSANNASSVGGGMTSSESMPTLTNCTFTDNTSSEFGGALRLGRNEMATITDCKFGGNSASRGGAVGSHDEGNLASTRPRFSSGTGTYVGAKTLGREATFTDCIFAWNEATYGGGLYCGDDEYIMLTNCTFCLNTASNDGGGVYCDNMAEVTLANSIIAFSLGGGAVRGYCDGGVTLSCSDVYGNSGGDWVDCIAGQDLINDNFWEDPLFCGPDNPDEPLSLHSDSPCCSDNNPACGQVGACGVGCATPVEMISWGSIKAMFR